MPLIQVECNEAIATISLDHYSKRNALSDQMISEILAAYARDNP